MADTAIAITAGSGTNVDTRTEGTNGNHRQVVVLGDPATNAGVAPVDATNGLAVDIKAMIALPAGSNAIGKLAANSGVDIGDVDILSIAAGDNNIGNVDIASALPAGTNAIGKLTANSGVDIGDVDVTSVLSGKTILRAAISAASSGDNTIIAAAGASTKNKILSVMLIAAGAVDVRFESGAGGTALTGVISLMTNSGFILPAPANPDNHWFQTADNALLNLELSAAVQVSGCITYYQEA